LIPCLRAVIQHEPTADVVIVDDGIDFDYCAPQIEEINALKPKGLWTFPGKKPFIYARNVNIGIVAASGDEGDDFIDQSKGDDVVLLNDDALLKSPGGFTALQYAAEEHPEFGVIGAVTNVTGQPLQFPKGIGLREVPHIAFVCVLIPRRTIDKIGLLDERYCLDYGVEDRDYCESVTRAGLKVGVHDGCFVDHGILTSSFRGGPHNQLSFQKNAGLFQQKWGVTP